MAHGGASAVERGREGHDNAGPGAVGQLASAFLKIPNNTDYLAVASSNFRTRNPGPLGTPRSGSPLRAINAAGCATSCMRRRLTVTPGRPCQLHKASGFALGVPDRSFASWPYRPGRTRSSPPRPRLCRRGISRHRDRLACGKSPLTALACAIATPHTERFGGQLCSMPARCRRAREHRRGDVWRESSIERSNDRHGDPPHEPSNCWQFATLA